MDYIEPRAARELVRRAADVLFKIPGVFSVGLGSKLVNGASTGELALSILVLEKKPPSALEQHEVIPAEIEGVPTDVLESGPPRRIADEEEPEDFDPDIVRDTGEYRPLIGGIQIRGGRSFNQKGQFTFGTLGGFAKTTGTDAGRRVLLTNNHVIADRDGDIHGPSCTGCTKGDGVGNPNTGSQIATVLDGKDNVQLDAAIAILDKGVQFQREIIKDEQTGEREAIGESRAIDVNDKDMVVHKRGMRSRITFAKIGAVHTITQPPVDGKTKENQIRIDLPFKITGPSFITFEANNRLLVPSVDFVAADVQPRDVVFIQGLPNAGRFRITEVVDAHRIAVASNPALTPSSGTHGFFVTPRLFAVKGDSGSLLLDPQRRVVGLVWAANTGAFIGNAWANHIEVVEDQLHIKIDGATTVGDTQVALRESGDNQPSDAGVSLRPAAATGLAAPPASPTLRSMVEGDLTASARGREIYQLYFTHHMEIRELIDSNRRVATVWHRQGGPGIVQAVLDAVRSRTREMPASIRGRTWAERVGAILAVFDTFGSARLREDIARFGRELEGLGGLTYPGFLERLET